MDQEHKNKTKSGGIVLLIAAILLGYYWFTQQNQPDHNDNRRLPVFVVDSKRTPAIARHVRTALTTGYPSVLHRAPSSLRPLNRRAACRGWKGPETCDEYPFAVTYEGGRGASVAGVPLVEQRRQGGDLQGFFRQKHIRVGDAFLVVVK
jgi:Deoxyribonuclease NucA/NucB